MRRLILILSIVMLAGLAYPMAQVKSVGAEATPASSFIIGFHYDYRTLTGNGLGPQGNTTGLVGFVGPLGRSATGGRLYGLAFGEMGNIEGGDKTKLETRGIYYLTTPGSGFNVGVIGGVGMTWNSFDAENELLPDYTIAYLLGSTGIVVSKPLSKLLGLWMAGEFQLGADYSEYRAGMGLNIYLGL